MKSQKLEQALALARQGLAVFPCLENKAPACPGGFKCATRDPDKVRDLWRRYPAPLIGVPTGAVNAFDVLDLDPRHGGGGWLEANRNALPPTRTHETRSGGLHVLFAHHDGVRNSAGKIGPGVDVRGDGGYIIWWPAADCRVLKEARLAPWPTWLLRAMAPPPPPKPAPRREPATDGAAPRAVAVIATTLARLEMAAPGERHYQLRKAAYTVGGLLDRCGFTVSDAERVLLDAVLRAGGADVDQRNATATIRWGLEQGRSSPLDLGGRV